MNFDSMTGRGRAIADLMKHGKVAVLCVQETRWSGNKAKELGDGYKMIYSKAINNRNGVGIILSKEMKNLVVEMNRKSDRLLWIRLALKDFNINIFSVYAPQIGSSEKEKEQLWADLQEEMEKSLEMHCRWKLEWTCRSTKLHHWGSAWWKLLQSRK